MAFATEVPGSAREGENPEGLPDEALAHSEHRPVGEIERTGVPFEVVSPYSPAGDQPAAIEDLEKRVKGGEHDIVLLGATGTGKSATAAWLIERVQRPTLVMAPNKTLAAQLANELRELLPDNAVEYFVCVLRLLPARGVHARRPTPTSRRTPRSTRTSSGCATRPRPTC